MRCRKWHWHLSVVVRWCCRNFRHARCDPSAKCCRRSLAAASPSRKNRFVVICVSRATSSVTLVYLAPKTMTHAVIRTVSYAVIKVPFAVTRIRHAARIASSWRLEWNAARHNIRRASRRHDARAARRTAQSHRQWLTEPRAKSVANAVMANAYRIARRRACNRVCVILYRMRANDAAGWASMKHVSRLSRPIYCRTERHAFKDFAIRFERDSMFIHTFNGVCLSLHYIFCCCCCFGWISGRLREDYTRCSWTLLGHYRGDQHKQSIEIHAW